LFRAGDAGLSYLLACNYKVKEGLAAASAGQDLALFNALLSAGSAGGDDLLSDVLRDLS
jgi:hypothetical protein